MKTHPELDNPPQFQVKILKTYRDCLTRQVGEAIAILLSPDTLLNSKNEYIQNCISRITVEEDKLARKRRLMEEEAEEKEHEEKVKEFKKTKRPAKRKTGDGPEGWKNPKKRKVEETPAGYEKKEAQTRRLENLEMEKTLRKRNMRKKSKSSRKPRDQLRGRQWRDLKGGKTQRRGKWKEPPKDMIQMGVRHPQQTHSRSTWMESKMKLKTT